MYTFYNDVLGPDRYMHTAHSLTHSLTRNRPARLHQGGAQASGRRRAGRRRDGEAVAMLTARPTPEDTDTDIASTDSATREHI